MKKGILVAFVLLGLILAIALWNYLPNDEKLVVKRGLHVEELPQKFTKSSYYSHYHLANKFVIYVDFSKSRQKRRLWVVYKDSVIATSFTAHGCNSTEYGCARKNRRFGSTPKRFSNVVGSNQSSLGIYVIYSERDMNRDKEHYCSCESFKENRSCGHKGRKFPLKGLEETNNNALDRGIVIHTGTYVSEHGCTANSDGCFTVSPEVFELLQENNNMIRKNKCYLVAIQLMKK